MEERIYFGLQFRDKVHNGQGRCGSELVGQEAERDHISNHMQGAERVK